MWQGISCTVPPVLHKTRQLAASGHCPVTPHPAHEAKLHPTLALSLSDRVSWFHPHLSPFSWYHLNMTGRWNLYITHKHSRKKNTLKTSRLSQLQRTYSLAARPCLPRYSGSWRPQESLLHAVIFLKQQPSAQNHQETPPPSGADDLPPILWKLPWMPWKGVLSIFSAIHWKTNYRYTYFFINKIWGIYIKTFTNKGVLKISSSVLQVQ